VLPVVEEGETEGAETVRQLVEEALFNETRGGEPGEMRSQDDDFSGGSDDRDETDLDSTTWP